MRWRKEIKGAAQYMPSKSLESEVNDSLVFLRNMGKLKIENGFIDGGTRLSFCLLILQNQGEERLIRVLQWLSPL